MGIYRNMTRRATPEDALEAASAGTRRALPQTERQALAREVVRELEDRGVPAGTWLVDISRAREALREADGVLRRLEDAIIRGETV